MSDFDDDVSSVPPSRTHQSKHSTGSGVSGLSGSRPTLQVQPGVGVGPFRLKMPLRDVVMLLADDAASSAAGLTGTARQTTIVASKVNPHQTPVRLLLPNLNLTLAFDLRTELLTTIEVNDVANLELLYDGGLLCGRNATPTFVRLYEVLGPTFAGRLRDEDGQYVLSYPGLEIVFRVPKQYKHLFKSTEQGKDVAEHPQQFPDGTTPVAQKLVIVAKQIDTADEDDDSKSTDLRICRFVPVDSDVHLIWGEGARFSPKSERPTDSHPFLKFGSVPQTAIMMFGPPHEVVAKRDSRMSIHAPTSRNGSNSDANYFMLCYPAYGFDLEYATSTNRLEKIIVFNAVPGHEAFLHYHRCQYRMSCDDSKSLARWFGAGGFDFGQVPAEAAKLAKPTKAKKGGSNKNPQSTTVIGNATKFSEIVQLIDSVRTNADGQLPEQTAGICYLPKPLVASTQEGSQSLYAFHGIHFATIQATGHIASVTLVKPQTAVPVKKRALNTNQGSKFYDSEPPVTIVNNAPVDEEPSVSQRHLGEVEDPEVTRVPVGNDFDDCEDDDPRSQVRLGDSTTKALYTEGNAAADPRPLLSQSKSSTSVDTPLRKTSSQVGSPVDTKPPTKSSPLLPQNATSETLPFLQGSTSALTSPNQQEEPENNVAADDAPRPSSKRFFPSPPEDVTEEETEPATGLPAEDNQEAAESEPSPADENDVPPDDEEQQPDAAASDEPAPAAVEEEQADEDNDAPDAARSSEHLPEHSPGWETEISSHHFRPEQPELPAEPVSQAYTEDFHTEDPTPAQSPQPGESPEIRFTTPPSEEPHDRISPVLPESILSGVAGSTHGSSVEAASSSLEGVALKRPIPPPPTNAWGRKSATASSSIPDVFSALGVPKPAPPSSGGRSPQEGGITDGADDEVSALSEATPQENSLPKKKKGNKKRGKK